MPTQRYMLTIAYRGTAYHGWQHQAANPLTWKGPTPPEEDGIPTVQTQLVKTISNVLGHPVQVVGSSRTDAGVHAKGQIAHIDTDQLQIPPEGLRRAVNARLPDDILIRKIQPVPETFHAIRSTVCKRYQYCIWNGEDRSIFSPDLAWHRWQPIDIDAMSQAASHLIGTHDFASFARPGHGRESTVRTILDCSVAARRSMIVIGVCGNGFLWNMVRIIAGTLVEVGLQRRTPEQIPQIHAARDRKAAGGTAPAHGLFLQWIRTNLPHPPILQNPPNDL